MTPAPLTCWLIGADTLLLACAAELLARGHRIAGVASDGSAVTEWCTARGVARVDPTDDLVRAMSAEPFDYLLSIANLRVIPREVLSLPRRGAVNFHDGPLPRYGGLHAPAWALLAQEQEHGITWHYMTDAIDAGDVVLQRSFPIVEDDTAFALNTRCLQAGVDAFPELLSLLAAPRSPRREQSLDRATYHGRADRPRGLGWLDWQRPSAELSALARAMDFGAYPNPLTVPRIVSGDRVVLVGGVETLLGEGADAAVAGTVLAAESEALVVATTDGAVRLTRLRTIDGAPLDAGAALALLECAVGAVLPLLDTSRADLLDEFVARVAGAEEFWSARLATLEPIGAPHAETRTDAARRHATLTCRALGRASNGDPAARRDAIARAFAMFVARTAGCTDGDLTFRQSGDGVTVGAPSPLAPFIDAWVPLRIALTADATVDAADTTLADELRTLRRRGGFARDLPVRRPVSADPSARWSALPVGLELVDRLEDRSPPVADLTLVLSADSSGLWCCDTSVIPEAHLRTIDHRFSTFLAAMDDRAQSWTMLPLMDARERDAVLAAGIGVAREASASRGIHELIEAQVARTPDAVAIVFEDAPCTYAELDTRANRLAQQLRALGARPGVLVAVACERSAEMLIAVLAVLKSGAAYVPLDPEHPAERQRVMLDDSQAAIVVTQRVLVRELPPTSAHIVCVDDERPNAPPEVATHATDRAGPEDLAYCIFTSGSTGRPKGVMVEHRNVLSFCAAMDERLGTAPGVWLAVTSLSFDISVLELLWTLTRGYKVVIHTETIREHGAGAALANAHKGIDFSLFYFSADGAGDAGDRYRMLMEGARFGDAHGFSAVWTPERHFHAFGGLFPNPAVTGAAIAAVTTRIGVRAGSCVLPLHHPVRVAEEWAMVDNLSHGRVGVSFAAGWQPDDFILQPENYATAKETTVALIDTVRRLWRGEAVSFPGPRGDVRVHTLPRPVQPELPIWFTTAGDPSSYELAGTLGVNLLTHLLGQTVSELADRITIYRKARKAAGHAGEGQVALMLHTLVGETAAEVRTIVRGPLKAYLATSVSLIKGYAAAFPTFPRNSDGSVPEVDLGRLTPSEMEALLDYSAERYAEASGLFGTVEDCAVIVDRLKGIGVDDVACLIDFGVETDVALQHLRHLDRLRARVSRPRRAYGDQRDSVAAQVARHGVTHLQCTPSLAAVLVASPRDRDALRGLTALCVGGEVLPPALAAELHRLVVGDVINLYGPTETTIWSTSHDVGAGVDALPVPIGRPLANTEVLVLDAFGQVAPPGVAGELYIGGAGVARGYWGRPDLTHERFLPHPLADDSTMRVYRTGDRVRWSDDGALEFLGRTDLQVKIRGHRIEPGEIEAAIAVHPAVRECVVVVRGAATDAARLVACLVWRDAARADVDGVREQLRERLPEFLVPAEFVAFTALPRTPNGKTDRRALAADAPVSERNGVRAAPAGRMESVIARIWEEVLSRPVVSVDDNFLEIGGRSLFAVQIHSRLKLELSREISVTDLFRFPTIRTLAAFLEGPAAPVLPSRDAERALARREVLARRRAGTRSR